MYKKILNIKMSKRPFALLLALHLLALVLLEWLLPPVYSALWWPTLPPALGSLRVLLVGDPQLLGQSSTGPGLQGLIERWDSDRYVRRFFLLAHDTVHPDVTVILGDVFDDGAVATAREYAAYMHRFLAVFHALDFNQTIIIPGDNDIGGENEPVTDDLLRRFVRHFRNDLIISTGTADFIKVNRMTQEVPTLPAGVTQDFGRWRILLSHMPLLPLLTTFVDQVVQEYRPHLVLSAHEHQSMYLRANPRALTRQVPIPVEHPVAFNLSQNVVHEILVPTCSYRMGTDRMGYGVLYLDPAGKVRYQVLWLPSRFRQLYVYLGFTALSLLMMVLFPTALFRRRGTRPFHSLL